MHAEEIAQAVFIILAQKAPQMRQEQSPFQLAVSNHPADGE